MTKHRDILKELRAAPAVLSNIGPPVTRILSEAADEIVTLRSALRDIVLLDGKRLVGRQKFDHAITLAKRALERNE